MTNESYVFPGYGSYRQFGLLKNPRWGEAVIEVGDPERAKLTIRNRSAAFTPGEVVVQPSSNCGGVVVYSNSSFLEISNPSGTFKYNQTGDGVVGGKSGSTANVVTANLTYFRVLSDTESLIENDTGATATIDAMIDDQKLRITDISGKFANAEVVYDPVTNAYATVASIKVANGSLDVTTNFGARFNQLERVPLTSNTGPFVLRERVVQDTTGASGTIVNIANNVDLAISSATGTYYVGNQLTGNNSGATGVVIGVKSGYLVVSAVDGAFTTSDYVINNADVTAQVDTVYPVLTLADARDSIADGTSYNLVGEASGSIGRSALANTVVCPSLVRGTGEVLYIDNRVPFDRSTTSRETLKLVCKF